MRRPASASGSLRSFLAAKRSQQQEADAEAETKTTAASPDGSSGPGSPPQLAGRASKRPLPVAEAVDAEDAAAATTVSASDEARERRETAGLVTGSAPTEHCAEDEARPTKYAARECAAASGAPLSPVKQARHVSGGRTLKRKPQAPAVEAAVEAAPAGAAPKTWPKDLGCTPVARRTRSRRGRQSRSAAVQPVRLALVAEAGAGDI